MISAHDIRRRYIDFFVKKHNHKEVPSASVVPENDPTVLFTTAGMHPLVPFLMGEPHPQGKRLVDVQKCVRTDDIEEVGDATHLTFFEMLGNWSLGDYFKREAIAMSFEFLATPFSEGGLGIPSKRLRITVFQGDDDAPRDHEAIEAWQAEFKKAGVPAALCEDRSRMRGDERIFMYGKKENWWGPAGQTGPCGPDTEMFVDTGKEHDKRFGERCHPNCDCGKFVELWNDVFMQYNKKADGTYEPLKQKNVDTGLGLERAVAILNNVESPFDTELFAEAIRELYKRASIDIKSWEKAATPNVRIIADHLRAATFILGDPFGVTPSNTDQGYVLRRLIRRAIRQAILIGINDNFASTIADIYIKTYKDVYPELRKNRKRIMSELNNEEDKFRKLIGRASREVAKIAKWKNSVSGADIYYLYDTLGLPPEITSQEFVDQGCTLSIKYREEFEQEKKSQQEKSRAGAKQKFAGGLADHSEASKMHHTATHLVHQALRDVLGDHVFQKGSNITKERLRFDFSHSDKMMPEQIKKVEDIVNKQIKRDLPVHFEVLEVDDARKRGAIGLFDDTYAQLGNKVKVYFMGDYSKEVCGGPHVEHTGALKHFKILKEEACSAGVRRIKAVVEGIREVI